MPKRKYELRKRAEKQAETRRRIVRAVSDLHRTVGPAHTTVSAVAERAGVRRLTVYRHFPNEEALVAACGADWEERHPMPDPARWVPIEDPARRAKAALVDLYNYYDETADMFEKILRDAPLVPAFGPVMVELREYYDAARDVLLEPWGLEGDDLSRAAALIGMALEFNTWQSLARQGLDPAEAARLMATLVESTAARRTGQ